MSLSKTKVMSKKKHSLQNLRGNGSVKITDTNEWKTGVYGGIVFI